MCISLNVSFSFLNLEDVPVSSTPVLRLEDGTIEKYAIGESFGILVSEDGKCYQIGEHGGDCLSLHR